MSELVEHALFHFHCDTLFHSYSSSYFHILDAVRVFNSSNAGIWIAFVSFSCFCILNYHIRIVALGSARHYIIYGQSRLLAQMIAKYFSQRSIHNISCILSSFYIGEKETSEEKKQIDFVTMTQDRNFAS